jgi:hypothetical protein
MNRKTLLKQIIKQDNAHQAHPIRAYLLRAAAINTYVTASVKADDEWSTVTLVLDNAQVVPVYVPQSQLTSVCVTTTEDVTYRFNITSMLKQMQ